MAETASEEEREKVVSKLPPWLRKELKVRAAQLGVDIQDAVAEGIARWTLLPQSSPREEVDTSGAESFSTWLPVGVYDEFRSRCGVLSVSYIQGLAQAVTLWLEATSPSDSAGPSKPRARYPRRIIVCNQKGGVGKSAVSAGVGEAYAEEVDAEEVDAEEANAAGGLRVLVVDYDPQGHLSDQLDVPEIDPGEDSLARHMSGEAKGDIRDLIVPLQGFGGRLHLLPSCMDGFLLDVKIAQQRRRERALEKALEPIEDDYDIIIIDCPPSLGLATDAALYYGGRRDGEDENASGVLIPVLAEDSSAKAYGMLMSQIHNLQDDFDLPVDILGLVVNLYDSRKGYVVTSSLKNWKKLGDPPVLAVVGDLKEQREAVRKKQPLLTYAPTSEQAGLHRSIAKALNDRVVAA